MRFDFEFFFSCFPELLLKIPFTLYLGILAFFISFALGVLLELLRRSKFRIVQGFANVYISFFRSTPYITQLFIFYFGLPQIIMPLRAVTAGTALIVTIALYSSALLRK